MPEMMRPIRKGRMEYELAVLLVLTATAVQPLAISAGVRYWDNPDFRAYDVGDYASGAVWNYDGIRNQGADQPHSTTATTWKNLGTSGSSNDLFVRYLNQAGNGWANSSAPASLGTIDGRDTGSWTEDGFTLTGDSHFRTTGAINTGTDYTLQMLIDATAADQKYENPCPLGFSQWNFNFNIEPAKSQIFWRNNEGESPWMSGTTYEYMTAILNGENKTAVFFKGVKPPTSGNGFRQFGSVSGYSTSGYCIGGHNGTTVQLVGTIKNFRYYKRVLTQEELTWNRVVDEARYFGRRAPIPVTNVVLASSYSRLSGTEPNGCYALDGEGYTFTAPASRMCRSRVWHCTGYTIEMWDGSAWSAPVAHDGETSYTALNDGKVRLTWQWTGGDGLVTYDIDDYVWEGLVLFWDGIRNVGRNLPHDPDSINWVNLGSGGSTHDLLLQRLNADGSAYERVTGFAADGGRDPGAWMDNGFSFVGNSRFRSGANVKVLTNCTVQTLIDARAPSGTPRFVFSISEGLYSLRLTEQGKFLWFYQNALSMSFDNASHSYRYATGLLNGAALTAAFFSGTTVPTSAGGEESSFCQLASVSPYSTSGYSIGGGSSGTLSGLMVGTIRNLRYYNRVLSDAEVAQNRAVDDYRYFGPSATNVFVVAGGGVQAETGVCQVSGTWTFTATSVAREDGTFAPVQRYSIETLSNGRWVGRTLHVGSSYTYTVGTDPATVRLKWLGPAKGLIIDIK